MPPADTDHAPTHVPRAMRSGEFADRVGRSHPTVSDALNHGPLKAARLRGGRVDVGHPDVAAWMASRGLSAALLSDPRPVGKRSTAAPPAPAQKPRAKPGPKPRTVAAAPSQAPDLDALLRTPLGDILIAFGSPVGAEDWARTVKLIFEARALDTKHRERLGQLIERALVERHVFGLIDGSWRRLVRDVPATIASRVAAMAQAGEPHERVREAVRQIIASNLESVKAAATRKLTAISGDRDPTGDTPDAEDDD